MEVYFFFLKRSFLVLTSIVTINFYILLITFVSRSLGGIPPLIELLNQDIPEIQRNACGALRNLSYGRQNDENKVSER